MAKVKAKGVIVKYGASPTPTTVISQLVEVGYEGGQWDRVETTAHDTSGLTKTYDTTLKEPSSIDAEVFLDPAGADHEFIRASHASGAQVYMTFILPDAGTAQWALAGHVTNFSSTGLAPGGFVKAKFSFAGAAADTYTA